MVLVNLLTIVFLILLLVCYALFVQSNKPVVMGVKEAKMSWLNLGILLLVAFIVRYVLAKIDPGHETDMGCFVYWGDQVYNDGFSKFYNSETFSDYPPGYMYILWIVGFFRNHIEKRVKNYGEKINEREQEYLPDNQRESGSDPRGGQ